MPEARTERGKFLGGLGGKRLPHLQGPGPATVMVLLVLAMVFLGHALGSCTPPTAATGGGARQTPALCAAVFVLIRLPGAL